MVTKIADFSDSCKFNWRIENFSKLNAQGGTFSDVFFVGDFEWKAHIYPKGNRRGYDQLSLFLCPIDLTESVDTNYSFTVTSQTDPNNNVKRELRKEFPVDCIKGWGCSRFMLLSELHDPDKGYLVDDTCVITVEITCTAKDELKDEKSSPNKVEKNENFECAMDLLYTQIFRIKDTTTMMELGEFQEDYIALEEWRQQMQKGKMPVYYQECEIRLGMFRKEIKDETMYKWNRSKVEH
ncbi:ubiquitin carboxyl-terminal hydrolase 12-like [Papaver somniferum]|uniref:ubiquitin carboxyl-terminal hydrolase 12-like n=1 Tax=Papaver somniferum TaxID=3469 RepID=UPI000E6F8957|nr:ubiquitin carboxyl-terminal hydrolase 12-like [Papaver somniferum]